MLFKALTFIDRFVLEPCRRTKSGLGRARILVFTQTVGPTRGASIADFLVKSDPTRGTHAAVAATRHGACFTICVPAVLQIGPDQLGQDPRSAIPVGAAA